MKLLKLFSIAALLFLAVSTVSAQNNLPSPNDDACWQSLDALHNCVQAQNDRAMAQAERCTSYPEYQCEPESAQPQITHVAHIKKQKSKAESTSAAQSHTTPDNSPGSDAVVINISPAN